MSATIGIFIPKHPDARMDNESALIVTSFAGPDPDIEWIQLSLGDNFIRLNPQQLMALNLLCIARLENRDIKLKTY